MNVLPFVLLNGALYGMLLFMLSAGLTVIYGMMGVINFAHASFYMLGAYLGYQVSEWAGFWTGFFLVPPLLGAIGIVFRRGLIQRIAIENQTSQLLVTFGAAMVITEGVQIIWGRLAVPYRIPEAMTEPLFQVGGLDFPIYRFFILAVSVALFAALYAVLRYSRVGLILSAAQSRPQMVRALGYDLDSINDGVFAVGVAVAGLAGVMAGNLLGVYPVMADRITSLIFVIVVVGGLGSLSGALVVSLALGLLDTAATTYKVSAEALVTAVFGVPDPNSFLSDLARFNTTSFAPVLPFVLMLLVLLIRPRGLFGQRDL